MHGGVDRACDLVDLKFTKITHDMSFIVTGYAINRQSFFSGPLLGIEVYHANIASFGDLGWTKLSFIAY